MHIKLIIGIGNPGKEYENTYHNVGILFVNHLKKSLVKQALIDAKLAMLCSDEYMNNSGIFVAKMLKKENVRPLELLIAHDDSDIEIGKYKFASPGRGAAGHHGIQSIQEHLKTDGFWRLRIGIRQPISASKKRAKAGDFVLRPISKKDYELLMDAMDKAIMELIRDEYSS